MFAFHKLNFTKPAFQNNMSSSTPSFTNPSNQGIRTNLLFVNKPRNQLSDKKNNFAYLPPANVCLRYEEGAEKQDRKVIKTEFPVHRAGI